MNQIFKNLFYTKTKYMQRFSKIWYITLTRSKQIPNDVQQLRHFF